MIAIGVWSFLASIEERSYLSFTAFDIGQGDALFIETPDHYRILIDGGPDATILQKLGTYMPFWNRSLDLVVLTHAHADHVAGLVDVIQRYRVGAVIESNEKYSTAEYAAWKHDEETYGISSYSAISGMSANVGKYTTLTILAPLASAENKTFKNVHEGNVVSELVFGKTKILLMGDAERPLEESMMRRGLLHAVDILKIGHHGSRTSSSEQFLSILDPTFAVISVGIHNKYGHPTEEVLDRIASHGIRFFRTDMNGDVEFTSDGNQVAVRTTK